MRLPTISSSDRCNRRPHTAHGAVYDVAQSSTAGASPGAGTTEGVVDVEGDSDGTAASDTRSAIEREDRADKGPGTIPPNLAAGNSGQ